MSQECKLLEGPAAASAQILLATAAVGALIYKRHKEYPQRSLQIWGMDISKQVISAAAAHICGIFIAILASENGAIRVSQCAWYFIAYSFDTTLGVAAAVGIHTLVVRLCSSRASLFAHIENHWCRCIAECGKYGNPPTFRPFLLQLVEWTGAVIMARIICGSVVITAKPVLLPLAKFLDGIFRGHPVLLLYFVMIMCPLIMNVIQALVQDAVLKFKKDRVSSQETSQHGAAEIFPIVKTEAEHVRLLASQPELSHITPRRESHGALPGGTSLQERQSVV
ncbi:g6326 [Coccomyxa elongata]